MFKNVKRKLKSRTGASLLMSLVFFLTAMMVGAVCLAAASSNAGRAKHNLTEQQEYYAVESVVNLICSDMDGAMFNKVEDKGEGGIGLGTYHLEPRDDTASGKILKQLGSSISQTTIDESNKTVNATVLPVSVTSGEKEISKGAKIKVIVGKKAEYYAETGTLNNEIVDDFTLNMTVYVGDDETKSSYRTKLTFDPIERKVQTLDPETFQVEEYTVITWGEPKLQKVGSGTLTKTTTTG